MRTIPSSSRPLSALLLVIGATALCGCPTGTEDPGIPKVVEWVEDDDRGNDYPGDAEQVDVEWRETVRILGEMEDCDYDQSQDDWRYTGDNDSYEVEVPRDGFIEAILDWESSSDMDLFYWRRTQGQWRVRDQSDAVGDEGPESILFEDDFESGDDIVLGVACANGPGGAYTLDVLWEE